MRDDATASPAARDAAATTPAVTTVDRRTVLGHLAALVGLGAVGLGGCRGIDTAPFIAEITALTPEPEAAAAIGHAFVEESSRTSRNRLAERLALELDWRPDLDRATLIDRLLERIASDFRDGKTLRVDHWVLSQTEVWWAALVALA